MRTVESRIIDPSDLDSERRETYRMPKSSEQQHAKLKIGKKLVAIQVLDESAGGFLISADKLPQTDPMQTVEMFSSNGAHYLRVAWRRNVDGRVRMGLQRLCHAPPQPESPWVVWLAAAVAIGIGVGFVTATSKHPNLMDRILHTGHVATQAITDSGDAAGE